MALTQKEQFLFSDMTWQEFEKYVIDILNAIYKRNNDLKIDKTSDRSDGGKDGYAILHISSSICSKVDDSLSYQTLFWVEVKKRTSKNIGEADIGGNILLALDANVNKLIFVSNRNFTARTKKVCTSVAKRLNTSVSFINGVKLAMLASNSEKSSDHLSVASTPDTIVNNNVSILTGFVSEQEQVLYDSLLSIYVGEVVFWICEITGATINGSSKIAVITNDLTDSSLTCECLTNDYVQIDNIETVHRIIFGICAKQPGEYNCKDILLKFKAEKDITIKHISSGNTLHVKHSILSNTIPSNRKEIIDYIEADFNILVKEKRVRGCLFEALAGSGKTFLINKIRQKIIYLGWREIYLDGALHKGVSDIVKTLTSQSFPVPLDSSSFIDLLSLKKWASPEGYSESKQDRVFKSLFAAIECDFEDSFDINDIALALALILSKSSRNKPITLIFEDLHKVNASVLAFIRNLIAYIVSRKGSDIYFLFSSRPHSEGGEGSEIEWLKALNELCGEVVHFSHYYIKPLEQYEAIELIEQSLRGVSKKEAYSIVEQVGTNPYNLKEALLYLESIESIERDPVIGSFIINSNKIKKVIQSKALLSSTKKRLEILIKKEGLQLQTFLTSAACLGKFFSIEIARLSCPNMNTDEISLLVATCEKYSILRFSNLPYSDSQTNCGFDHDLIRLTVIQNAGTFSLKHVSSILIKTFDFSKKIETLLQLSYLAGDANLCRQTANTLVKRTKNTKNYQETLSYTLIDLAIILRSGEYFDKSSFLRSHLNKIDECFGIVDIPRVQKKISTVCTMDALLIPLEMMGKIGTFEKELSEKLITLGAINSEFSLQSHHKSSFKYYEGRLQFSQSKYIEALKLFRASEDNWPKGKDARGSFLSKIRVRKFICERQLGNLDKARQEMDRALRLRNGSDWELLSQVSANLGAFHMYDNQNLAKKHWKRGLRIARATDNYDEIAHFLNDLGHIDLMLDNYSKARENVIMAASVSEKYGIIKERIRSNIFLGCIEIIENKLDLATVFMGNAENEAVSQYNLRRLWRIHANLATIAELDGRIEDAYVKDRQSLVTMPIRIEMSEIRSSVRRHTRVSGALANIVMRYQKAPDLYKKIKDQIPQNAWEYTTKLQKNLTNNSIDKNNIVGGIRSLYKNVKGTSIWRFILTE